MGRTCWLFATTLERAETKEAIKAVRVGTSACCRCKWGKRAGVPLYGVSKSVRKVHLECLNRASNEGLLVWLGSSIYSPLPKVLSGIVRNFYEIVPKSQPFSAG